MSADNQIGKKEFKAGNSLRVCEQGTTEATTYVSHLFALRGRVKNEYDLAKELGYLKDPAIKGLCGVIKRESGTRDFLTTTLPLPEEYFTPIQFHFKDNSFPHLAWIGIHANFEDGIILQPVFMGETKPGFDSEKAFEHLKELIGSQFEVKLLKQIEKEGKPAWVNMVIDGPWRPKSERKTTLPGYAQALQKVLGDEAVVTVNKQGQCSLISGNEVITSQRVYDDNNRLLPMVTFGQENEVAVVFRKKGSGETDFHEAFCSLGNWRFFLQNTILGQPAISFRRGTEPPILQIETMLPKKGLMITSPLTSFWDARYFEVEEKGGFIKVTDCKKGGQKIKGDLSISVLSNLYSHTGEDANISFSVKGDDELYVTLISPGQFYGSKSLSVRVPFNMNIQALLKELLYKPQEFKQRAEVR